MWSPPAAVRALRTTVVATGLFAYADQVIGNVQVATFAAFGSFATLLLSSFGGGARDKLRAHIGLALAGSVLLTIGTLVSSSAALATLVTIPVTFVVFFAGVLGPNVASGGIAAMLAYVLPVASPGTAAMIPDRLAGWWMASIAGTLAVLATTPRVAAQPLRAGVSRSTRALAAAMRACPRRRGRRRIARAVHRRQARADRHLQLDAVPAARPRGPGPGDGERRRADRVVHLAARRPDSRAGGSARRAAARP